MKKLICRLSVCAGLFLSAAGAFGASTYYVAKDGDDGAAGTADAPWATVTHAVATALAGDVIHVGEGTWTWSGKVEKGFTIEGEGDATILKTTAAVTFNAANLVIKNCRLGKNAGANYCSYALTSGTISNCWFTGCSPQSSTVNTTLDMSGGLLVDCRITGNTAGNGNGGKEGYFGAVAVVSGNSTIRNCWFKGNNLPLGDEGCDFFGAGALYLKPAQGATVTIEDTSVIANSGGISGGVTFGSPYEKAKGNVILRRCVFAANKSPYNFADCGTGETHGRDLTYCLAASATLTIEDSLIGAAPSALAERATLTNVRFGAPGFTDELNADYTLLPGSRAFGWGYAAAARGTSFSCAVKVPEKDRAIGSLPVTLEAALFNAPAGEATYEWDLDGDGTYETTDRGASFGWTFDAPGWHKVGLKVTIGGETAEQPAANLVYVAPKIIYAAPYKKNVQGNAVFPYASMMDAAKTMTDALKAALPGSVIRVGPANGSTAVTEGFSVSDLTIFGDSRTTSILSGAAKLFNNVSVSNVKLTGTGTFLAYDSSTISNCWVTGHSAATGGNPGGTFAAGLVTDTFFSDNKENNSGGTIISLGGTVKVRNCVFTGNVRGANGNARGSLDGVIAVKDTAQMENCVVFRNEAGASSGGDATVSYRPRNGAGLYIPSGTPVIRNCVIRDNLMPKPYGTGDYSRTEQGNFYILSAANPTIEYCNIPEGQVPACATNCQTANPSFTKPDESTAANRDFTLKEDSPCIDAGLYQPWQKSAVDAAGNARFQGYRPDIGAYEFAKDTPQLGITPGKAKYSGAQDVTLTAASVNGTPMADGTTYLWTIDGEEQDETSGTLVKYLEPGTYAVTATSRECGYFSADLSLEVFHVPGVDFTLTETGAGAGFKTVDLTAYGVGGFTLSDEAVCTWAWTNADETASGSAAGNNLKDVRIDAGTWDVYLTAANADGAGLVLTKTHFEAVSVDAASVSAALSATEGEQTLAVTMTATATGFAFDENAVFTWIWASETGAQGSMTGNAVEHIFTEGTWTVSLKVENADGKGTAFTVPVATPVVVRKATADWYVDTNSGSDENAGTAAKPFASLAKAIDRATEGQEIRLVAGTHSISTTVALNKKVTVRGAGRDTTILQGPFATTQAKTVRGVTITAAGAVLADMTLTGFGPSTTNYETGGAIKMTADGVVSNCHITANTSYVYGGSGCGLNLSKGLVVDCVVDDNKSAKGDYTTAMGSAIRGGGIHMSGGTVRRTLIARNRIGYVNDNYTNPGAQDYPVYGGGVFMSGGRLENCTVVGNENVRGLGGNVYVQGTTARIENCVISGGAAGSFDSAYGQDLYPASALDLVTHSIIGGAEADHAYPFGSAGLDADYGLTRNSSFDDVGWKPSASTALACGITADRRMVKVGSPVTLKAILHNAASEPTAVTWTLTTPDASEIKLSGAEAAFTPEQVGGYDIALSVTVGGETVTAVRNGWFESAPASLAVTTGDDIHAALARLTDGCTLNVSGTISVTSPVKLFHGITVVGEGRDATTVRNTKTGDGQWRVFDINATDAVVKGLTITGGYLKEWYPIGAGARIGYRGGRITECTITGNNAGADTYGGAGGVFLMGADARVDHCVISGNSARQENGGGVVMKGGTLDNCLVVGNTISGQGNNAAFYGAGVALASTAARVRNCTIVGNTCGATTKSSYGGGLYFSTQPAAGQVLNTILVENASNNTSTYGGQDWAMAKTTDAYFEAAALAFVNCAFETCDAIGAGSVKFAATPFTDAAGGDYTVKAGSASIDAGADDGSLAETDLAGTARVMGWKTDIGAYEAADKVLAFDIASSVTNGYEKQVVTLTLTGDLSYIPEGTEIAWTVDGEPFGGSTLSIAPELDVGDHSVAVTVDGRFTVEKPGFIHLRYRPGVDFTVTAKSSGAGFKTADLAAFAVGGIELDEAAVCKWYWTNDGTGDPDATGREIADARFGVGSWTILLRVENADGRGATYERTREDVVDVPQPGVVMAFSETEGEGRTLITMTASASGFEFDEGAAFEWRWTDLESAAPELTGNPATGTFRAGTWSVQVVVANADGAGLAVTNVIADAVTIAPGADFYVAATGDNANPGTKKSPYKTLAAALNAAAPGQKIKISGLLTDSYQHTVSGVEIYGDGPAESGLWSSDQSCYLKLTDGAFIHGIRIGQSREQGGILRMADDSCVVSNCWVVGNWFSTGGSPAGSISAGLVTHTLFSGNHCNYGPVLGLSGTAKVRNCVFTGNTIDNGADTKQTFKGVVVLDGTAVFENNTVYGNTAVLCSDNVARQVCAGVYVSDGTPTVRNNIIWNNRINGTLATGTVGNYYCKAGEPVLANNCTEEGVGENPVTADPGFTALDMTKPAEQRDFSITTASPCCDRGAPAEWLAGATDYAGNPRVMGWGVDIGAYEAVAKILEFGIEPAASVVTGAQAVAVAVTGDTASVPAGAVVRWFVDGEEAEPQGLSVNLPLEEGHHDIAVDLGGFFRVERKDCVWVKTPEAVDFTTDEVQGDGRKTVTFTAIARGLEFDPAAEFSWYWNATGEGDPDATGNPAVHTFGPGTYDVFVRVTNADGEGGTLTTNKVAAVVVEPMTASIRLSSTIGETSKSVALTAVASGFTINPAATCTWTWTRAEDGATGTLTGNPAINVYTTGTYSFALRITNADGEGAVVEASLADALRIYAAQSVEIPSGQGTTPVYLDQLGKIPFKTINGQPITGQGELTAISADSYRAVEDVADYGAVGDGRTDDTAAIMAAIEAAYASGKPLYFPKNGKGATYLTRKGLILRDRLTVTSDPGVTLANASAVLDGAGQTLHINLAASVAKGATSCTVVSSAGLVVGQEITLMNASADSYAETLADVERIEGNTVYFNTSRFTESGENEGAIGAYSATGMVLTDISLVKSVPGLTAVNCTVENLTLRPYGNAADPYVYTLSPLHQTKQGFRSNNTLRVRNVTIEGSKHDGISAQGSGDIWIENCVVRDVKHKGIHWGTTCDRITIRGNLCLRCGSAAAEKVSNNGGTGGMYFCYNNHRVLIEGNRMVDCYRGVFGFDERDASGGVDTDSLIANNIFENCTANGVSPDGFYGTGRHLRIAGNQFIRFTGTATPILFTHDCGLSGSVISGNVFGDFQDGYAGENGAILIANANGVVIRGNVIERNPSATGSTDVRIVNSKRIAVSGNVVDGVIDDTDEGNANIVKTDNVEIKEVK